MLLAVPLKGIPKLALALDSRLDGKVIIDANNAYPDRDGDVALTASAHPGGTSSWVAKLKHSSVERLRGPPSCREAA